MKIQLSDHFTYGKLLRFVGPSAVTMIFTSLFSVIDDGLFVSNFVGKDAFVAINIMIPITMVFSAIAFMLGAGGNALVSKLLGEQQKQKAAECFSAIVYFTIIVYIATTILGLVLLKPYCLLMGAKGAVYDLCIQYGLVAFPCSFAFLLQGIFQTFLVTDERPTFAMVLTIVSGVCNILFDILLIVVLKLGIVGAVLATVSGPFVTSVIPLFYFIFHKNGTLHLVKTRINLREIGKICALGVSQLISNLSMGLVSMVYNYQLMRLAGDNGVAAYGVIMYLSFIFLSAIIGYSSGIAPIIGFHYGANNTDELKSLYKKSMLIITGMSIFLTVLAYLTAVPFSKVFVSYDPILLDMTVEAYQIYGISFLFAGFGIFASSLFTSLSDGLTAGIISFARTMFFQIGAVLIMPLIWGVYGVWYAPVVAEILATAVAFFFCITKRKKYHY